MVIIDAYSELFTRSVDVLNHYPGPIAIAAAITSSAVMAYSIQRWADKRRGKGDDTEMKRRAVLDQMYADDFGDVLFNRMMLGDISRHEYKRDCRRFGIAYRLGDLLVRKNPKRGMKYRIKKNCAEIHSSPAPKLPDEKSIPVLSVPKRKVWVAVGVAKLRHKSV